MDAAPPEVWISFGASSFALLISAAFLLVVTRNRDTSILPFATAAFDVSLVSITLIAIALAGRPFVAVNSHVVWPIYVLTIVATAFRLDFRVCAFAGAATVVEYSLILAWITGRWGVA